MDWDSPHILEIMQGSTFNTIRVVFLNGISGSYTYKTREEFAKYDYVVVSVFDHLENKPVLKIAKVVEFRKNNSLIDFNSKKKYKWAVCKVDMNNYNEIMSREKILLDEIKEMKVTAKRNNFIEQAHSENRKNLLSEFGIEVVTHNSEEKEPERKNPIRMG